MEVVKYIELCRADAHKREEDCQGERQTQAVTSTKIHVECKQYTDWTNIWPDKDRLADTHVGMTDMRTWRQAGEQGGGNPDISAQ